MSTQRIEIAVERLYDTGWRAGADQDMETLADGRRFPSVLAVQREFARRGLELSIKHNMMFNCYRANWQPADRSLATDLPEDARVGTVVAACEREAAVYCLAQLRSVITEHELATREASQRELATA